MNATILKTSGDCFFWTKTPLLESDPSPIYYTWVVDSPNVETQRKRRCIVKNPVSIGFDPNEAILKDDSKQHEGVRFSAIWQDEVARILWLGHKPFYITSQYFRASCINTADHLRRNPEILLWESVGFSLDSGWMLSESAYEIGAQLVPYLITALHNQRRWPFFPIPPTYLTWSVEC